jgi:myb proto-oncogene protein
MAAPSPNAGALRACADRRWKPGEDAKLTEAVKKHGGNWVVVATCVPCRTNNQCGTRWRRQLDPDISKGTWKPEEDAKLTVAVNEVGKEWVRVAAMVPGRTDTQCRSRWVTCLVFAIFYRGKWSLEEDSKLTEAVKELGNEGSGSNGCTVSF